MPSAFWVRGEARTTPLTPRRPWRVLMHGPPPRTPLCKGGKVMPAQAFSPLAKGGLGGWTRQDEPAILRALSEREC